MSLSAEANATSVLTLRRSWLPMERTRDLAAIFLVALLARAITIGNPVLHVDESFYFTVASAMADGARLYTDIWDRKPVGLFLVYLLPALAGPAAGVPAYQALALFSVIATALVIRQIARAVGWERGALPAALAYILWLNLAEGEGGQSPVFYNLPMAFAACCVLKAQAEDSDANRLLRGAQAMLLTGLAMQIKYTAMFEGVFFGLWLLHLEYRRKTPVPFLAGKALLLVVVALLPTLAAAAYFHATGQWDDFFFANFESIFSRGSSPSAELAGNAAELALILCPLLALAFVRGTGPLELPHLFLRGWLAAALLAVLLFGTWFDHYGLPVMLPATCCAAAFFARHPRGPAFVLPILAVAGLAGQALLIQKRVTRGTAEQVRQIAAAVGHGRGCLLVYSGPTILYPLTGRCSPSTYVFPSHLHRRSEEGATGVSQMGEVERIMKTAPDVIVMLPPNGRENPLVQNYVTGRIARHYRLKAVLPLGSKKLRIFSAVPRGGKTKQPG